MSHQDHGRDGRGIRARLMLDGRTKFKKYIFDKLGIHMVYLIYHGI